jgi:biopolymer transport protein ExbD
MSTNAQKSAQPTAQAMYDATRKRRVGKRRGRKTEGEITELNITPMLDMMTILLVFLIKSFASSASNVTVANLTLPHSTTKLEISEAVQLTVTEKELLVDHKVVTQLDERGGIRVDDLPDGVNGYLIQPLYDRLEMLAAKNKQIEKFGGTAFVGRIAVIADEKVEYQTLVKILYTAGRAEYGQFKLFVQKPAGS